MARRNNKNESKKVKKSPSNNDDDFNTGSHSPSSVRKVGAGYDDTGLGNDLQTPKSPDKNVHGRKKKTKENK